MKFTSGALTWILTFSILTLSGAPLALAQEGDDADGPEEIVVTGSFIRRSTFEGPSPVQQITADDIAIQGASTIVDVATNLTMNTSSDLGQYNLGGFTGGGGRAQFNLRGLGLAATLTLVDGHRAAPSAGGSSYVNISQIPSSMVERIDILKTGASATYGSDAVSGVVNIITKKDYQGFEMNLDHRNSTTTPWDETTFSLLGGASSETARATVGFEFKDRAALSNRDLTTRYPPPSDAGSFLVSSFGNPGSFAPATGGGNVPDPLCGPDYGLGASLGPHPAGFCSFDIFPFFTALPDEQRRNVWANFEVDLDDTLQVYGQVGYSRQKTSTGASPSLPATRGALIVPGTHPDFPAALAAALPGAVAQDVRWRGRPYGANQQTWTEHFLPAEGEELLLALGLVGAIDAGLGWNWNVDLTESFSNRRSQGRNDDLNRMQDALDACRDPLDPLFNSDAPGCWNPFGNQITDGTANSPEVFQYFRSGDWGNSENKLRTYNAVLSGGIAEMAAGELGVAVGFQYRDESHFVDREAIINRGGASFSGQSNDSDVERDVTAVFAEMAIPFEKAEIQLAVRTEDYGGNVGKTTDPRIAVRFNPIDALTLRASWGTSFRAPPLNRLSGASTGSTRLFQPNTGSDVVRPTIRIGQDLQPEEAESTTLGLVYENDEFRVSLDIWDYDYDGLLTTENAQELIDDVCDATSCDLTHPRASQLEFDSAGEISQVTIGYVNAARVQARGIDLGATWGTDLSWGSYDVILETTYLDSYEIQNEPGGPTTSITGQLNGSNFSRALPELRANLTNSFGFGDHRGVVVLRYVDGVTDERGNTVIANIPSRMTVDARYTYDFEIMGGTTNLSLGAINLLDDDIPQADQAPSYAPDLHDPRGRVWYMTLNHVF